MKAFQSLSSHDCSFGNNREAQLSIVGATCTCFGLIKGSFVIYQLEYAMQMYVIERRHTLRSAVFPAQPVAKRDCFCEVLCDSGIKGIGSLYNKRLPTIKSRRMRFDRTRLRVN